MNTLVYKAYFAFEAGIDAIRTAPVGLGSIAFQGALAAYATAELGPDVLPNLLPVTTAGVVAGVFAAARQFKLRDRLEEHVEQWGYDERAFASTTTSWCGRQTARVVAGQIGYLEEYQALCQQRADSAQFSWLPHF